MEVGEMAQPAVAEFTLSHLSSKTPVTRGSELSDLKSTVLIQLLLLEAEATLKEEGICPRSTELFSRSSVS